MRTITESKAKITSLYLENTAFHLDTYPSANNYSIASIVPYLENGEMAAITWFALCNKDGDIIHRVNGSHVASISYDVGDAE